MAPSAKRRASTSLKSNNRISKKKVVVPVTAGNETTEHQVEQLEESNRSKLQKDNTNGNSDAVGDQVTAATAGASINTPSPTTNNGLLILDRINEFSSNTWWMVDLYVDPAPRQGATLLVRRCMNACRWGESTARSVLKAYRQFLFLKKETKDWNAQLLMPSASVDQMWRQHILDVVNYAHDCMLLCGFVVGYNPDAIHDNDEEGKQRRRDATHKELLKYFGPELEERGISEWSDIFPNRFREKDRAIGSGQNGAGDRLTARVRTLTGREFLVHFKRDTRMQDFFELVAHKLGIQPTGIHLHHLGKQVSYDDTPQSLQFKDYDTIICSIRARAC
jgi:hypothetical protein